MRKRIAEKIINSPHRYSNEQILRAYKKLEVRKTLKQFKAACTGAGKTLANISVILSKIKFTRIEVQNE